MFYAFKTTNQLGQTTFLASRLVEALPPCTAAERAMYLDIGIDPSMADPTHAYEPMICFGGIDAEPDTFNVLAEAELRLSLMAPMFATIEIVELPNN